jgi:SAM-dependent methyltransferase
MSDTTIHDTVKEHYAERAREADSCCAPNDAASCCDSTEALYPEELLTDLPDDVADFSLGCGDPITLAKLQPGQHVLDLGSGGGLDCFLAARQVGASGYVIGVDMTPEMLAKARASAERLGLANVEFRQGYLEDLPVEEDTIDVVISNCVINLSPDKAKVFSETFRVLKPGGKLAVSDIVIDGPLPAAIKDSLSMWAGCVSGAVDTKEYTAMMEAAGFTNIEVTPTFFDKETVDEALLAAGDQVDLTAIDREEVYKAVYSARITANKPIR